MENTAGKADLRRKQEEILRGRRMYELSLGGGNGLEITIVSCQNLVFQDMRLTGHRRMNIDREV